MYDWVLFTVISKISGENNELNSEDPTPTVTAHNALLSVDNIISCSVANHQCSVWILVGV